MLGLFQVSLLPMNDADLVPDGRNISRLIQRLEQGASFCIECQRRGIALLQHANVCELGFANGYRSLIFAFLILCNGFYVCGGGFLQSSKSCQGMPTVADSDGNHMFGTGIARLG